MWKYPRWIEFVDGLPKTATGQDPALPAARRMMRSGVALAMAIRSDSGTDRGPESASKRVLCRMARAAVRRCRDRAVPASRGCAGNVLVRGHRELARRSVGGSDRQVLPRRHEVTNGASHRDDRAIGGGLPRRAREIVLSRPHENTLARGPYTIAYDCTSATKRKGHIASQHSRITKSPFCFEPSCLRGEIRRLRTHHHTKTPEFAA